VTETMTPTVELDPDYLFWARTRIDGSLPADTPKYITDFLDRVFKQARQAWDMQHPDESRDAKGLK